MLALIDATIRYRDAGLCSEDQCRLLAATLARDAAAVAVLDQAIAAATPLTLAQYDAHTDAALTIDDRTRYGIAFGALDPRINDFAMDRAELAEATARALERGTPMTDDEIAYLGRNVLPGVTY